MTMPEIRAMALAAALVLGVVQGGWAVQDGPTAPDGITERAVGLGSFVRLGASARGISLGRAYTALAGDDAMGVFWNPAAVAEATARPRFALSNRFFGNQDLGMGGALSFVTVGGTVPLWKGFVVGLGIMHLGVDGIEQYTQRAEYLGDFSDSKSLVVLGLGHRSGPISVGFSAKLLHQGFSGLQAPPGSTSGSGTGFDMGLVARFWRPLRIGVVLRDQVDVDNDRAPMSALVGVACERRLGGAATAVAAIDVEQIKNRPARLHMGLGLEGIPALGTLGAVRFGHSNRMLEGRLSRLLAAGFREMLEDPSQDLVGDSAQWALGFGLTRGPLQIDYTFSLGKLHDPQYISVGYDL